jgi:hypothetical protein
MAMTIGVNKRPQGFDFASLIPGMGPHFQRLQGTGQVDQGMAQTIGGMRTGIDALASGMPLYDSASFNSAEVGRPSSQPIGLWYGYAGNNQEDNAAQNVWNLTNNANLDRNAYLYGRPDSSRIEDGLSRTDYFDAKGAHKYTDVLNDPTTVGKMTSGDIGLIASGLAAMGGLALLGPMLAAGGAAGGVGGGAAASGAGAGAGAGAGGGSLLSGTLEPLAGSVFEVGLGNTAAGVGGAGFGGATGALGAGATGGLAALPYGSTLTTTAGLESILGGLGGAPGLASGIGTGVGNAVSGGAGGSSAGGSGAGGAGGSGGSGGMFSGSGVEIPGFGNMSWGQIGSTLLGSLAGSKGQQQSQTQTRELPPYLQGPVTGKNGLLSSADRLMQHQLYGTPMGLLK